MSSIPDVISITRVNRPASALSRFAARFADCIAGWLPGSARERRKSLPSASNGATAEENLKTLQSASAALLTALDHGESPTGIVNALGLICVQPLNVRTANELKKLETHLINRVHEAALPFMRTWRGRPKPELEDIYRAVQNNIAFADVYGLPAAEDKHPLVDQKALVAALGVVAEKLKGQQRLFCDATKKASAR
jgi:hypothetical protein